MNTSVNLAGIKMKNPVTVASRNIWLWKRIWRIYWLKQTSEEFVPKELH